jgi:predicted nucleic acid-binding protein
VLAAMLLVLLPELLRDLADYRLLLFGAAIGVGDGEASRRLIRQPRPDLLAAAQAGWGRRHRDELG